MVLWALHAQQSMSRDLASLRITTYTVSLVRGCQKLARGHIWPFLQQRPVLIIVGLTGDLVLAQTLLLIA